MSYNIYALDSSLKEEHPTIIVGKHIILKVVERPEDKRLLEEPRIKDFLNTQDLAHDEVQGEIRRLIVLDTKLEKLTSGASFFDFATALTDEKIEDDVLTKGLLEIFKTTPPQIFFRKLATKLEDSITQMKEIDTKAFSEFSRVMHDEVPKKIVEATLKRIEKLNKEVLSIAKSLKRKNKKIDVIQPTVAPLCPNCKGALSKSGIITRVTICKVCNKRITPKNVNYLSLNRMSPSILHLYDKNIWFEEYIAKILRKLGWEDMWTHSYVLGASGVRHEIDVLGIKRSRICLAECKTGKIKRADVFNFWTKAFDIRSHINLFASLEEIPEPETRQFLESNPSIVLLENVKNIHKEEILERLKSSLLGL